MRHGNVPCLSRKKAAWLRDVFQFRKRYSNKALAASLNISTASVVKYGTGKRLGRG